MNSMLPFTNKMPMISYFWYLGPVSLYAKTEKKNAYFVHISVLSDPIASRDGHLFWRVYKVVHRNSCNVNFLVQCIEPESLGKKIVWETDQCWPTPKKKIINK